MKRYEAIIIGGGAAGFFAAIRLAEQCRNSKILIIEKSDKLLSKVKVSGGGRCNVTHACFDNKILAGNYPRGGRELLSSFHRFNTQDTVNWFEKRGVKLKAENDGRMFPVTDDSQTIVNCLIDSAKSLGVEIMMKTKVNEIEFQNEAYKLTCNETEVFACKRLLVATGGHAKANHFQYLNKLNHSFETPVPSLFTFNLPKHPICKLMGVSVSDVKVKIAQTGDSFQGPLLITHWGLSGPVVLKLSSFAARKLHELDYNYDLVVNWLPLYTQDEMLSRLREFKESQSSAKIEKRLFAEIPQRLWEFFLWQASIDRDKRCNELGKKEMNTLAEILVMSRYAAHGKTTFKEEFVTCGGVKLKEVDFKNMESKLHPGLFFAGEVLNIDGITGGFNFQAAWTTGYLSAEGMAEKLF
jgi:predicted Rossmann fold flavoprotein